MASTGIARGVKPAPDSVFSRIEGILAPVAERNGFELFNRFALEHGSYVLSFRQKAEQGTYVDLGLTPVSVESEELFNGEFWVGSVEPETGSPKRFVASELEINAAELQECALADGAEGAFTRAMRKSSKSESPAGSVRFSSGA